MKPHHHLNLNRWISSSLFSYTSNDPTSTFSLTHTRPPTKEFSRHAPMPPQQPHQIPISRFHVTLLFASPSCHQEILQSSSIRRVSSFLHATINSWLFNWVVMTTLFIYCHIQRWLDHLFISLYKFPIFVRVAGGRRATS